MFNFDPNDPRQMGLLMAAARMLEPGPGGVAGALSRAVPTGLMSYQAQRGANDRRSEEEQQRAMRGLMMDRERKSQENEQKFGQAFQNAFGPNQNLVANDDMGNPMPQAPFGGGMSQLVRDVGAFDPRAALSMMPKPQGAVSLARGGKLVDPTSGRVLADNPEPEKKESLYGKVNPSEYTEPSLRKFAQSGNHADLVPYRKPDRPDSPRPQLHDGPNGPMWVTPPQIGAGASVPVTDEKGNPIPGKKRDQPLTESQAKGTLFLGQMREAEKSISGLKFKPETTTAQAQLAAALRAKEAPGMLSGTLLNVAAGKDAQQYAQAAEQWSEAFLRIKTGAASTRDEVLRNVRTFFPQPGDTPDVIKQKNQMRASANKQMEIIAGQGVQQLDAQKQEDPLGIR